MHEFIYFIKYFAKYCWFSRGVIACLLIIVAINGLIISFLEKISIANALYFTFITALTIGYGDITPATGMGKMISVLVGILGMILMGLIIAIATLALKNAVADIHSEKGK